MVAGLAQMQVGRFGQAGDDPLGKLGVGVDAGADGGAAQRQFAESVEGPRQLSPGQGHLAEVAAEDLAEPDRGGVLQVGAADGDDVVEGQGFFPEHLLHAGQGRNQPLANLHGGGQVHRRGDDVVARLAEIDVIVGVHRMAAGGLAEQLAGPVGQHLVGVHVGAGPRTGLEDVEGEVRIESAAGQFRGRGGDRLGPPLVEQAEFQVDPGGLLLDQAEGAQERAREGQAGDREILDGAGGLRAVEGVGGDRHRAERVMFDAGLHIRSFGEKSHGGRAMRRAGQRIASLRRLSTRRRRGFLICRKLFRFAK